MPKLVLTIGTSSSGKSTWAKGYLESNPNAVELNRDILRFGGVTNARNWKEYSEKPCEKYISECMENAFFNAMEDGYDVVISDTNLCFTSRHRWMVRALQVGAEVEFVIMHSAVTELFSNPSKVMQLPDHVLHKQYSNFQKFLTEEPKDFVKYTFV